jgi:hypothetical protein
MAIPATGLVRIYPSVVTIVSGDFSVAGLGVGAPSAIASQAALQAYYDTRTDTPANAPRTRYATEIPGGGGQWVPAAATYELSFSSDTTRILFDPSGVADEIDFLSADFPQGVVFDQLYVKFNGNYFVGPARDRQLTAVLLKYFGSTVLSQTLVPGTGGDTTFNSPTTAIIPAFNRWSPNQTFKTFGFAATLSTVVSALTTMVPSLRNDLFYMECAYNTLYFNTSLVTPNALPGNIAEINGSRLDIFDLLEIYWDTRAGEDASDIAGLSGGIPVPANLIFNQTDTNIRFQIPNSEYNGMLAPYGGRRLMLVGTPSAQSLVTGKVPLQSFNIELVDGSGLYTLVANQHYDTYYDRSSGPPVPTVDLKIPDPMIKTGLSNA